MRREAWSYVAGGAGLETTMDANRAASDRHRIVPRMMRDVSTRDLSVELFGRRLDTPFLLAPIAVLELVHPQGDLPVAKAAAAEGVPLVISNQASKPMEEVAAAMGDSPRWFQLYWGSNDELVESLVGRAEACGCEAIVVTLDTTFLGWRPRDLDLAYLPFALGKGLAQYTSDPVFRAAVGSGKAEAAGRAFLSTISRSLKWDDLSKLRGWTKLPVVLKGIVHPDDARLAVEHGADAIVVSTHGGRQVDGAIGSLDALPTVVAAVAGRVPVLFDSGIRSGADVFKAIALGARAVLIGRPYVYGLALGGDKGVREVLANFAADLDLTLALSGHRSLAELGPESLESTA
jgi:isopentenyl diphosphate isomerase/L-lactate dehydrogenase-like FMN-dependent dehydrogenase